MEFYPFFRRPYYNIPNYNVPMQNDYASYQKYRENIRRSRMENIEKQRISQREAQNEEKIKQKNLSDETISKTNYEKNNSNKQVIKTFEMQKFMGLESDDILIIVLLLFLYNEGVRDNMLFLALILLLLT